MNDPDHVDDPPRAPDIQRRIRFYRWQWIALPPIMLVPVLALFGAFGVSRDTAEAFTPELMVEISYPSRFRYKQIDRIHAFVANRSQRQLDTVTVVFDSAYIARFSTVTFTPSVGRAYEVELTDVQPGERRLISVELQGEEYWRHGGEINVTSGDADTARVRIGTIVFP
jgi:hypothetical protein